MAITDIGGGVYRRGRNRRAVPAPLPPGARHRRRRARDRAADNEKLFALDVDVLVLAALEGQITAANAGTSGRGSWPRVPTAGRARADPILATTACW